MKIAVMQDIDNHDDWLRAELIAKPLAGAENNAHSEQKKRSP